MQNARNENAQFHNELRVSRQKLASKLDESELAVAAVRIGSEFDAEIDKARRDEGRRRRGSDGGSGD